MMCPYSDVILNIRILMISQKQTWLFFPLCVCMCLHLLDNQTEWPNSLLENLHKEKNTSNKSTGLKTLLFKSINSCKNHHLDPFTDTRCNLWNKNKIAACISIHKQSFSSSKKLNLFVCSFPKLWQCNEWNIISHLTRIDMLCIT